jgi:hypothetical protein
MKTAKYIFLVLAAMLIVSAPAFAVTERLGADLPIQFSASKTLAKTAAYTITASDCGALVEVTATSANIVITLPDVSTILGTSCPLKIIKKDATAYKIVVTPAAGHTVGKESTRALLGDESYVAIHNEGKDWKVDYETAYIVEDHEAGTYTTGIGSGGLYSRTTVSTTLTASACGNIYTATTGTQVFTLPATVANCKLTFVNGVGGAAGGMQVDPNAADQIFGGFTLASSVVTISDTAGDSINNTAATSVKGDYVTLIGDGVDGWFIVGGQGIWAED